MNLSLKFFGLVGSLSVILFICGVFLDLKDFDRTKGAYQPPYIGATGTPIDWSSFDATPTGLVKRGYVIDLLVDGTTGMISIEIFKRQINWGRGFSERALIVHKPREAFIERGFEPEF